MNGRSRAFTLIELLVASLAASLLLVGALAVISLLARDRVRTAPIHSATSHDNLIQLIRSDLSNAGEVSLGDGSISIESMGAIQPEGMERSERPVLITYRVVNGRASGTLIREQRFRDEGSGIWREIVASGVSQFKVTLLRNAVGVRQGLAIVQPRTLRPPRQFQLLLHSKRMNLDVDRVLLAQQEPY